MPELSEFEKQRQANIARNKALLQKLNLNSISSDIYTDIKRESSASPGPGSNGDAVRKKRKTEPKKREPVVATRRSRRIAGVKLEDSEEARKQQAEFEEQKRKNAEIEKLKNVRLSGDLKLVDLLSDENGANISGARKTRAKQEADAIDDNMILNKFNTIGKSISMGDFYETVVKRTVKDNDKSIVQLRESFDKLQIYPNFNPLEIKITPNRMTSIAFHPSIDSRLVLGGDTAGYLGLWSIDTSSEGQDSPDITILKPHGKTVAKITMQPNDPYKMYSCSYDGSIRSINMKSFQSSEIYSLDDQYGDALGVSDINFSMQDSNLCYFSTLQGHVSCKDLRMKPHERAMDLLRCHDKKIGGFSINPNFDKQIVTASLDRSLKIWDLRNIGKSDKHSFYNPEDPGPHLVGSYNSRLSISCADWNSSGDIVCNGYDDTINVFNMGNTSDFAADYKYPKVDGPENLVHEKDPVKYISLAPSQKLRHNCQTGRWVSILKSKWQANPKDGVEKFVIANMNRFFDIYTANGIQVAHLGDSELVGAVPAVVAMHPTENWVVGGSASGKGYLYI